jgi:hypothetical protein
MAYYANPEERARLIAGLYDLARFLRDHPDAPAPRWADVLVFPPEGTYEERRAEVDRIAASIGAEITNWTEDHGHYAASRGFGPVQYRVVAISAYARSRQEKAGAGA